MNIKSAEPEIYATLKYTVSYLIINLYDMYILEIMTLILPCLVEWNDSSVLISVPTVGDLLCGGKGGVIISWI
jgi:hypothetical protein